MGTDDLATGREIQAQLWPQMATGGTPRPSAKLAPDFYAWVAETAFGKIWSREALPIRDRSLITVAMLAALGKSGELRGHLAGARNLGISQEELVEVLMQVAVYAGVPAANEALTVAAEVFGITV
ncbi:MAG TPA: carboxymuconolactone decarboxylase family protein [Acidimicrobiales bacterium]|nr:carboxymuconolactone decarboxylase family protein [Acidimicrobiales bacterium]